MKDFQSNTVIYKKHTACKCFHVMANWIESTHIHIGGGVILFGGDHFAAENFGGKIHHPCIKRMSLSLPWTSGCPLPSGPLSPKEEQDTRVRTMHRFYVDKFPDPIALP